MATIRVTPIKDGERLRGSWKVTKNGRTLNPPHRKKSAARRHAKREASAGDTIEIRRLSGTVQNRKTV